MACKTIDLLKQEKVIVVETHLPRKNRPKIVTATASSPASPRIEIVTETASSPASPTIATMKSPPLPPNNDISSSVTDSLVTTPFLHKQSKVEEDVGKASTSAPVEKLTSATVYPSAALLSLPKIEVGVDNGTASETTLASATVNPSATLLLPPKINGGVDDGTASETGSVLRTIIKSPITLIGETTNTFEEKEIKADNTSENRVIWTMKLTVMNMNKSRLGLLNNRNVNNNDKLVGKNNDVGNYV